MATVSLVSDEEAGPEVRAVFDDIRAARKTDFINNFWRALANDPPLLAVTWSRLKEVMAQREDGLDRLTKELVYIAVSVANGCSYCIHSHTAAARAKGLTEAGYGDLMAVIAMAQQTNALVTAMQVPVDEAFKV